MGDFRELEARTLGELVERVTPAEPDPVSGRLRDYSIYRGVADGGPHLLTSLDRLGGCHPPHSKAHLEEHILRNFIRFGYPFLKSDANVWEIMVTAQHHGLPTRLLDWSYSPLVAAHFATLDEDRKVDRVIWKLNWRAVHRHFQLKPLAFLVSDLDALLKEKGYPSGWDLFQETSDRAPFLCMLEPPALDNRIVAQSAAFTMAWTRTQSLDSILEAQGLQHCLTRIGIPHACVRRIRDQLDLCTIDERRIYPGLDGIATEITRYYSTGTGKEEERT